MKGLARALERFVAWLIGLVSRRVPDFPEPVLPAAAAAARPRRHRNRPLTRELVEEGGHLPLTPAFGTPITGSINGSAEPPRQRPAPTPPVIAVAAPSPIDERAVTTQYPVAEAVKRAHQIRDILSPNPDRRSFVECACRISFDRPTRQEALDAHRDHVRDAIEACERFQTLKRAGDAGDAGDGAGSS